MIRRINDKEKVMILEEILKSKDILFDENLSDTAKNVEWKRIADFANKKFKLQRDVKYYKGSFWYNCRSSLGRKVMGRKNLPLTRAHLLTMEILGQNSVKALHNNVTDKDEDKEDVEMESQSSGDEASSPSKMKDEEDKENSSPRVKRDTGKVSESEDDNEILSMKKRKLEIEIEHAQILLNREKVKEEVKLVME